MFLAIALLATGPAMAQQPGAPPSAGAANETASEEDKAPDSLFGIIFAGGFTGLLIVLLLAGLSIGAAALVIEHLLTIRQEVLMPAGLGEQVRDSLAARNLAAAEQACQQHPSFLAFVLRAGLSEIDGGWPAVEKAMEDATAEQAARLFRKIELLSVIGNIAPMVGLLGTVMGMIFAFQEVADTQGAARAAELARGIYTALVTTVGGLIVAIPALAAFALFRNRVDQLVAETAYTAQHAVAPLKRARVRAAGATAPPPPPTK
jgi:biopolymer transport protein ExbB